MAELFNHEFPPVYARSRKVVKSFLAARLGDVYVISQFSRKPVSFQFSFLARDASVRTNRRATDMMFVCLSGTGVRCDHTVRVSADLSLWLDSPISGHPDTKACPPTPSRLFPVPPGRGVGYGCVN